MTMKKYRERIEAQSVIEVEHPGSYFTMLRAVSPVDVEFLKDYRITDAAIDVQAGLWFEPEQPFDRVRISNKTPYPVIVEFLLSFGRSGWQVPPPSVSVYSKDIGGLGGGLTMPGDWVDLGEEFASAVITAQFYGTVSAGSLFFVQCSPDMITDYRVAVGQGWSGGAVLATGTLASAHISSLRAVSRYVRVNFTNGPTIQAAGSREVLTVMRNVTA